jgi:hypothetical protein
MPDVPDRPLTLCAILAVLWTLLGWGLLTAFVGGWGWLLLRCMGG